MLTVEQAEKIKARMLATPFAPEAMNCLRILAKNAPALRTVPIISRRVDVIAAGGFDHQYVLPIVCRHLRDENCIVHVRQVRSGCVHHYDAWPSDPWECVKFTFGAQSAQLRYALKRCLSGGASHVVVFAESYKEKWFRGFARRNIKVFAVHVGREPALGMLKYIPGGFSGRLLHEKDLRRDILPALMEFVR